MESPTYLTLIFFALVAGILSWVITKIFLSRSPYLDVPNERSSHNRPTPRGGGIGLVIALLALVLLLPLLGLLEVSLGTALFIGGAIISGVGLLDDKTGVRPLVRLLLHLLVGFGAALIILWSSASAWNVENIFLLFLGSVFIAWMTNLYNFMDGTDGLAATQAITVALWMWFLSINQSGLSILFLGIATTSFGFLLFNWSPAKIFMGDVGSGFLGYFFGASIFFGFVFAKIPLESSLILMSVFFVDSTYTVIVRFYLKRPVTQAHRDHAYQHAVRQGWSHEKMATVTGLVNLFWLGPFAWLAAQFPFSGFCYFIIAIAPILTWQWYQKAGQSID